VRAALISRVDRAVSGLAAMLRMIGHEPIGALTTALGGARYGADSLGGIAGQAADGFDVVVPGSPSRIAPLLAALHADVRGLEELERRERLEEGRVRRLGAGNKSIREMVGAIFPTSELVIG
jgi:hypothetical protein